MQPKALLTATATAAPSARGGVSALVAISALLSVLSVAGGDLSMGDTQALEHPHHHFDYHFALFDADAFDPEDFLPFLSESGFKVVGQAEVNVSEELCHSVLQLLCSTLSK
mmetsp:Transcript_42459/g.83023  ORF Transcript_42459/g.83023 Transcript_42459/m.83023 type:complete len:111 (+) Transcript_42459:43-375(+)